MDARTGTIERTTRETQISVAVNLDGSGACAIRTGFGFADHMLDLMGHWAGFDLEITCSGDMHIDAHHSLEDIGLCLGGALSSALGDRKGIARVGCAKVPMDEALTEVCWTFPGARIWCMKRPSCPPSSPGRKRTCGGNF